MTQFAFVDQQRGAHDDVTVLCRLLKVSRAGFNAWLRRPPSPWSVTELVLTEQIRAAFTANRSVIVTAPAAIATAASTSTRPGS